MNSNDNAINSFDHFLATFDKPGSIVLLEGKREVLDQDISKLEQLSKILSFNTDHIIFRSGNAPGADALFCEEIIQSIPQRLELITPYASHRKKSAASNAIIKHAVDDIDFVQEESVVYNSKVGNKNDRLIDAYVSGQRNRNALKAAYLIRDTVKVVGTSCIAKANFAIFYDDLSNPKQGGTGHTMKVCEQQGISYINQSVWFNWLSEAPPYPKGSIYNRW